MGRPRPFDVDFRRAGLGLALFCRAEVSAGGGLMEEEWTGRQ